MIGNKTVIEFLPIYPTFPSDEQNCLLRRRLQSTYAITGVSSLKPRIHVECHQLLLYKGNVTEHDADNLCWYLSGEYPSWIHMYDNQLLRDFSKYQT